MNYYFGLLSTLLGFFIAFVLLTCLKKFESRKARKEQAQVSITEFHRRERERKEQQDIEVE
jgi:phosphate/sulfate permease